MIRALLIASFSFFLSLPTLAADYKIDVPGMHAYIGFKIKHLGYSWLVGRFNQFDGNFSYDASAPENSSIEVDIDLSSIDTNHAERDKHLRGKGFFDVEKYPNARFVSTAYHPTSEHEGIMEGKLTLRGVTQDVRIKVSKIGEGADPWGGYRVGFEGSTQLSLSSLNMKHAPKLGPASENVELFLSVEGIRK